MKRIHIHTVLLLATAAAMISGCSCGQRRVDWRQNYHQTQKSPFGCYILCDLLPGFFNGHPVQPVKMPLYNVVRSVSTWTHGEYSMMMETGDTTVYIAVTDRFTPDDNDMKALMEFVRRGNNAFVSAAEFSPAFEDSLGFQTIVSGSSTGYGYGSEKLGLRPDTMRLTNQKLQPKKPYIYPLAPAQATFLSFDTSASTVLGRKADGQANFIRVQTGRGNVYVHISPVAFSNIALLDTATVQYAARAVSYLPAGSGNVLWDEYYKPDQYKPKSKSATRASPSSAPSAPDNSPLGFIMKNPPLRWSLLTLLGGLLLLVIFSARRRQRIIPVQARPVNTTLQFTDTVGKMYYRNGDHKNIAEKRIASVSEYIRSKLMLKTSDFSDEFAGRVSERSGAPLAITQAMLRKIAAVGHKASLTEQELLDLNNAIELFRSNVTR